MPRNRTCEFVIHATLSRRGSHPTAEHCQRIITLLFVFILLDVVKSVWEMVGVCAMGSYNIIDKDSSTNLASHQPTNIQFSQHFSGIKFSSVARRESKAGSEGKSGRIIISTKMMWRRGIRAKCSRRTTTTDDDYDFGDFSVLVTLVKVFCCRVVDLIVGGWISIFVGGFVCILVTWKWF